MALPIRRYPMLLDFIRFSRGRSARALALIVGGALLEGAGIIVLVPMVALILGIAGNERATQLLEPLFAGLGLESIPARMAFVLVTFALIIILRFAVLFSRDDLLARMGRDFVVDLRVRAFRHLSRLPWAEVVRLRQGPIGHALIRDVDRVAGGVGVLVQGGVAIVMLVVQFGLALALAPAVTLLAAATGLGLFRALHWQRDRAEAAGKALTREDLALFETVSGFLKGLKPAKAHGLEADYVTAFERSAIRMAQQTREFYRDQVLARLILQSSSGAIGIAAILLGLFVFDTPPETLIVALVILARLYTPLQAIQNTILAIRHASAGYERARELAGPPARMPTTGPHQATLAPAAEPLAAAPEISLEEVSFRADGDENAPILASVTCRIPAGQVTALIGPSGAGKSTLCDMAVGLLAPGSGEVRLDGAPLDPVAAGRLRASVSYIGQEPFLIEESLRHNLVWGCGAVTDAEIWAALETVGAADLARGVDGGLDGSVRAEGLRFSGGERQRMRLVRALLRKPGFMILDEATNALDLTAEAQVLKAVFAARHGATVLMISHRPAALALADHVVLLDRGRIVETGPVPEVMADPQGRVRALMRLGVPD